MCSRLEAEIEEAHLKAKEEMMQGIQMAKEVAQKELSDQKAVYEDKIRALERELVHKTSTHVFTYLLCQGEIFYYPSWSCSVILLTFLIILADCECDVHLARTVDLTHLVFCCHSENVYTDLY